MLARWRWILWLGAMLFLDCAWGQFSPGALSKAHKSLNGPAHCTACHEVTGHKFKCLGCHSEIRERLDARRGLHLSFMKESRDQKGCIRCHSEHYGERFVPIRWDMDLSEFDHGQTGYVLEGGHQGQECRKCHNPRHIASSERRTIVVKDLARTYLGLSRECLSCHADEHRGQLPSDCQQCHTFSKWKPASKFNHAVAKYSLDGAHLKASCEKCHQKAGEPVRFTKYTDLPFQNCDGCHKDPHHAAFSAPCKSCHSEQGWKPAQLASHFDHAGTAFALLGKHSDLACDKCHATSDFKQPIPHARCMDCHKTDVHRGQFASRADGGDCSACHVVDGWKPTTYNALAHRLSSYPLEGRHFTVECGKCHKPQGEKTVYRIQAAGCGDCHQDPHQAQFAGPPHGDRCEDCHTVRGFRPSTFSVAKHEQTRLPLTGAHIAVTCGDCHYREAGGSPPPGRFHFTDLSCNGCHENPHQVQAVSSAAATDCEGCHVLQTWQNVSKFDHSTTSFPLSGSHRGVPCEKCHRQGEAGAGTKAIAFQSAPEQCSGCHEDIHGGQFSTALEGTDCSRCHSSLTWKPATFDHNQGTKFKLLGAHGDVKCRQCHRTERQINGKPVVMFKPTPAECEGCHEAKLAN